MRNQFKASSFLILIFLLVTHVTCIRVSERKENYAFQVPDTIMAPVLVKAGDPVIHHVDSKPAEKTADIFFQPSSVKNPAGFMANIQNFNTDHGLAMSSILCGFKDISGNLWFGTSGNGVSKYDGKSFTNFYSSHGLIHNLINCITQDSKGNMWFGTYGGISKYNGVYFENFTTEQGLPNNDINKIHEDRNGIFWIATSNGLSKYDPGQQKSGNIMFVNYSVNDGLTGNYVREIYEDNKGNIWITCDSGVCKYDPVLEAQGEKSFTSFPGNGLKDKEVSCIIEDEDGIFWFGTSSGIIRVDPEKGAGNDTAFFNLSTKDGLIHNKILCSIEDTEGNLWFGTRGGVSEFVKATGSFLNYTNENGLADNIVNSITQDKAGSLWFGTLGGGLSRYDGNSVSGFTARQGIPGNAVYAITEDTAGNMWFGTNDGGITKYTLHEQESSIEFQTAQPSPGRKDAQSASFLTYSLNRENVTNEILTMLVDKENNLWFGNDFGLYKNDGNSTIHYTSKQGLVNDKVVYLSEDSRGNLWIGTYEGGVSKFDGKSFTNFTTEQGLVHNTVWCIYEDSRGYLWFATRGGLSLYNGKNFTNFTIAQGLPDNKLSSVIEDRAGNIIIGSWGGGVSIIRKNVVDILRQAEGPDFDGTIFSNFSTTEGLSNDVVYSIKEDSAGNIFIGTNVGISVLKGGLDPTGMNIANKGIENFNQATGYPIRDVSNNCSMYLDSRGVLWAGTGDKLVRFDYSRVRRNAYPPEVIIKRIRIDNENISWRSLERARVESKELANVLPGVAPYITDQLNMFGRKLSENEREIMINNFAKIQFDSVQPFYAIPENLVLPYAHNNISFDFVGIETTRPFMVLYQYQLKGHDEDWSPLSLETSAGYSNLPQGSYTFLLKAQSPEGIWSEPVSYSFEILPPWYRSWVAYFFYVLIFMGGILAVDRYQRRRLIAKERQRTMKRELDQAKEIEKSYIELKETQALLIQAEKMASLGELTAGVAHEIQNPLNFVNNFAEVSSELIEEMKSELNAGNQGLVLEIANDIKLNLEKINHHGKRADAIVKGMLQHSRSNSGGMEPTDINALADEFLRLAYHGLRAKDKSFNASLKTDFDETLGKVKVVPQDIGRVILNLITNAFYAVNEKKAQLGDGYHPTVSVATRKLNSHVEVSIKDNGNGISAEVLEKIYQPFFTTKPSGQGTGLGLPLSYDIIKAHGGELKVETREGEGTTFTIVLQC